MEGENRVLLMGRPEDGGTSSLRLIPHDAVPYTYPYHPFRYRIRNIDAQHVRARYSLGEDGAGTGRHLYGAERTSRFERGDAVQDEGVLLGGVQPDRGQDQEDDDEHGLGRDLRQVEWRNGVQAYEGTSLRIGVNQVW